jgi:protein HOOK3
MTQYFADVLQKPTSGLDVPDLQAVAKDHTVQATLTMCRLTIAIGVQCEKNKQFIDKIQGLSETDQHYLMKAIEQARFIWLQWHASTLIHITGHGTN